MKLIALKIPGLSGSQESFSAPPPKFSEASQQSIGYILSQFLTVFFYAAGFLMLFWFAWGVFQYIFAGGNKEGLAKARQRMVWAITGFIIVALSFLISQFAQQIFPQVTQFNKVTPVTVPGQPRVCSQDMIRNCDAQGYKCVVINDVPKCVKI